MGIDIYSIWVYTYIIKGTEGKEMTNTIKVLATLTEDELNKAMAEVKATDEAKAKALKEIEDYKEIRNTLKKWFKA